MVLIKERIGKMLEYLKDQIYPESVPIGKYRMIKTDQRFADVANLDTSDYRMSLRESVLYMNFGREERASGMRQIHSLQSM